MNLAIDIALWAIVVALGVTLFLRDQPMFSDALRFGRREFFALLPRIAIGMIGSGFIAEILPKELIPTLLGPGSGVPGLLFATIAGALTPGGPVVGFGPERRFSATAVTSGPSMRTYDHFGWVDGKVMMKPSHPPSRAPRRNSPIDASMY